MIIKKLQQLKSKKGFTLVELLVVIAIIGILAAVLIPLMATFLNNARISNADSAAKQAKSIVDGWLQAEANSRNRGLTGTTAAPVYASFIITTPGSATGNAVWTAVAGATETVPATGTAYRGATDAAAATIARTAVASALSLEFTEGFAGQSRPALFVIVMQGPNNLCVGVAFAEFGTAPADAAAWLAAGQQFLIPQAAIATIDNVNAGIRQVTSGRHPTAGIATPTLNRIVGTFPAR